MGDGGCGHGGRSVGAGPGRVCARLAERCGAWRVRGARAVRVRAAAAATWPRRRRRWRCPGKYGVSGLRLGAGHDVYVAGTDNEVLLGQWEPERAGRPPPPPPPAPADGGGAERSKLDLMFNTGFRGDGRWVGFDVVPSPAGRREEDVVVCASETGHLYAVRHGGTLSAAVGNR